MKKIMALCMSLGLFVLLNTTSVQAAEVTAGADFNSAYVWRGITFNDGFVFQPYVDVSANGFGINIWGNMDIEDYDGAVDGGEFSEVDITLSYQIPIELFDLSVGYIEYVFPSTTSKQTREIYVSASYDFSEFVKGISAGFDVYYDFGEVDDVYANLNAAYEFSPMENLTLTFGVAFGLAGQNVSHGTTGGFHDVNVSLGGSYAVTENISVNAQVAYTDSLDTDVLPEQDINVYGGVGASVSF
ncbi:MAG: MltA-interacting MipA family protein [Chlamydiota bacterium]|nr:MltA-interacting MipA family protein [Chlamydiota bacterium]